MATFKPISYTYIPTRLRSTKARPKVCSKPFGSLEKNLHSKLSSAALSWEVDTDDIRDAQSRSQDTDAGTINNLNNVASNDNDCYLPTVEEILYTALRKEGFAVENSSPEHRPGGGEAAEDSSGTTKTNPVVLGDNDSDISKSNYSSYCDESLEPGAGLFSTADLDNSTTTAQLFPLAVKDASVSLSIYSCIPSPRLSSELLHDCSRTDNVQIVRTISTASALYSDSLLSQRPDCFKALPLSNNQEDHSHTARNAPGEDLPCLLLGTDTFDKQQQKQYELEEEDEHQEGNEHEEEDDGEDEPLQQRIDDVATALFVRSSDDTPISNEEVDSTWLAKQSGPKAAYDISSESGQEDTGSNTNGNSSNDNDDDSDNGSSDYERDHTDAKGDREEKWPFPVKQKRTSLSDPGPQKKKRKHCRQQSSIRQYHSHRTPLQHCSETQLPLPHLFAAETRDAETLPYCFDCSRLSADSLPVLNNVTFRPYSSPHLYSFTAEVRTGHDRPEFSVGQFVTLIENIGHIGEVTISTIKLLPQHVFLVTGVSRYTSSWLPHSRRTLGFDIRGATSKKVKSPSSDNNGDSGDNVPDHGSDVSESSTEDEQEHSSMRRHKVWLRLDEERLLAYKKEGKSWSWIFRKFPARTQAAVRTRWTIAQARHSEQNGNENDQGTADVASEAMPNRRRGHYERPSKKN